MRIFAALSVRASVVLGIFGIANVLITGCASSGSGSSHGDENAVVHTVSPADIERTHSKAALTGDSATLYVTGLGCPLCASNIDQQLMRVGGITSVNTDLSLGMVKIVMGGESRPSPLKLANAVEDAGFTLVKIEGR